MCVCVCGLSKDVEYSDRGGGCIVTLQRLLAFCSCFVFLENLSSLEKKVGCCLSVRVAVIRGPIWRSLVVIQKENA